MPRSRLTKLIPEGTMVVCCILPCKVSLLGISHLHLLIPRIGAASEAAFMTGLERNSDIVFGASYSPLLNVS
jgi:hypothetical protein